MPKWLYSAGYTGGIVQAISLTWYYRPQGYSNVKTSESHYEIESGETYILSNLWVRVTANTVTADSTLTSRKNRGNGNQTITIGDSATGTFEDTTNTDTIVATDEFDSMLVTGGTGTALTLTIVSMIVECNNNSMILGNDGIGDQGPGVTAYNPIGGRGRESTTEADAEYKFRTETVLSNLRCYVSYNSITAESLMKTRINNGDGSQILTIPASTSGEFEDVTNSDIIIPGDDVCTELETGATGSTIYPRGTTVRSRSIGRQMILAYVTAVAVGAGISHFEGVEGGLPASSTTETKARLLTRVDFIAGHAFINVTQNDLNDVARFVLRKNDADSSIVLTIAATATGQFEDIVEWVEYDEADTIDWNTDISAAGSGTITYRALGFEYRPKRIPRGATNFQVPAIV